ncbi:hypothetical protein DFH07DRAFT_945392 [Mycena maculata]|uniref:Uncharacterized protein n=1 Tax=Mycena maculata TaxID=230809 RepID=A0AAD7HYD6_9AGAR|nr:hypothetical protein DFH07DRAFT_945392 [Mycena maculata]
MTRSASPTGVVFSYDFPSSALSASSRTRPSSPRRPSPVRPHWEYVDEDREEEYASYGYPSRRRGITVPIPTGNQWRTPSPLPLYPYSSAVVYPQYPYAPPSSYESESSCSSASHQQHKKIKKAHPTSIRSIESSSPRTPCLFTSSSMSSPYSSPESTPYDLEDDFEPKLEERGRAPSKDSCKPHLDLRRQWAALSLRVKLGVFRAKRRLRSRVLGL